MRIKNDNFFLKSPFIKGDVRPCLPAGGRTGGLAYTLFELLVSISIIAVLVAVASVSYSGAQKKARDSRRMEDLTSIQKAAEMYYSQHSYAYPASAAEFVSGTVLEIWPKDPKTNLDYTYTPTADGYCVCVELDGTGGNSTNSLCTAFVTSEGTYFCVKNQQ